MDTVTPRRIIVGISGPSCSGKTSLARRIGAHYPQNSEILDLDSFYRDREFVATLDHGHDNPQSVDFENAWGRLRQLQQGCAVEYPVYCYATHRVIGVRICQPRAVIVLEGLFVFADERLRSEMDLRIWLDSDDGDCLQRRIQRDTQERQRSAEDICSQYARDVAPGFEKYIKPLRRFADLALRNDAPQMGEFPVVLQQISALLGGEVACRVVERNDDGH